MQPSLDFLCGFRAIPPARPARIRGEQKAKSRSARNKVEVSQESGKDSRDCGWWEEDDFVAAWE
jgi:hypothetical protein